MLYDQYKDDPSRNDDLTQSRIEESRYETRLAELEAENDASDGDEGGYDSS